VRSEEAERGERQEGGESQAWGSEATEGRAPIHPHGIPPHEPWRLSQPHHIEPVPLSIILTRNLARGDVSNVDARGGCRQQIGAR